MSGFLHLPTCPGLAEALALIATRSGTSATAAGLMHGLALENGKLSATFLPEAAARAGLQLAPIQVTQAKPAHCPLLLVHTDGRALVIMEVKPGGLAMALNESGQPASILLAGLAAQGFSLCWSVRSKSRRDSRTNAEAGVTGFWLKDMLWLGRDAVWPVVGATVVINLLALAVPLISMNIMDRVVTHAAFETLWALTIGGLAAIAMDFVLRMLRSSLVDRASARADVIIANRIFSRVLGARLSNRPGSVGVQSNSLREYESLREICNSATVTTLGDLPFAILFFAVIWVVAGPLVLVPLAVVPLLLVAGLSTQWTLNKMVAENFKDMAHKNAVAVEMLSGLETIKAHAAESWAASKWEGAVASHLRHSMAMRWWTALSSNLITSLQSLTTIALLVVGVYLVVGNSVSPGALFATIMLAGRSLTPVAQVASLLTKIHHAKSAYKAIRALADVEQDRPMDKEFLGAPQTYAGLELERVGFAYRKDGPEALKNISLKIRSGERLGIIGSIGSGKSSLLRLMLGLRQPSSGAITMGGLPIAQIDPAAYRGLFGCAFREEAFFFGTIRENLCFQRHAVSDEQIVAAARMGGALGWIKLLPSGFGTMVGESGQGLSSGQRQTLALSRAFLGQVSAILLDEPTSDLDARSEAEFVERLKSLPKEQTLIVVTHRPAVLEACDRLLVMEGGTVLLDGEKAVVLARLKQIAHGQRAAMHATMGAGA